MFDFSVVAIALIPASGPLAILRALRILRLLRVVGRVRRLRRLVESLLRALPSIGWILVLLLTVIYIFGVMGTQLFGDDFPRSFGTLGRSAYSLFQIMTLESWSEAMARPVMEEHPWAWGYFAAFILVSTFTVLNLFIGIIVSTMQEGIHAEDVRQRESFESRAHAERGEILETLRDIRARLERLEDRSPPRWHRPRRARQGPRGHRPRRFQSTVSTSTTRPSRRRTRRSRYWLPSS